MLITVYSSTSIKESEASQLWNLGVDSVFIDDPTSYKDVMENLQTLADNYWSNN